MKRILSILILVALIMALFIPAASAAKKITTPEGKTVYEYTISEKQEVARVVYAEARNQPFLGKVAVALVAIHRFENNKGKYSMRYITRNKGRSRQFAKAGKWIIRSKKKSVKAAYEKCYQAVEWAIDHRVLPRNCTLFQKANRKQWGRDRNKPRFCRIGDHTFYTNGKAKPVKGDMYIDKSGKLVTIDQQK